MKKRLLIINNISYPVVDALINTLGENPEYDVTGWVASGKKEGEWNYRHTTLENIFYLPSIRIPFPVGGNLFHLYINPGSFLYLLKLNPHIIIICGWDLPIYWTALIYSKLLHKRIILWSGSTQNEKNNFRALFLQPVKWFVGKVDNIIAFGQASRRYLFSLGVSDKKIEMGFYACEADFFKSSSLSLKNEKEELRKKYKIKISPVFLYLGQLIERKGIDLLIQAFEKMDNKATLIIAGEGREEKRLKEIIHKKGIANILFLSSIHRQNLQEIYRLSDILILPSRAEVWGLVVNEAMTCGLPVIVSDVCGCSEDLIHPGKNGFVFESENVEDLSNKMKFFLDHPLKIDQMGENSKKIIKKFTVAKIASTFLRSF